MSSELSQLGSLLSTTGAEIGYLNQELKVAKDVTAKELKEMTSLVKTANKTLVKALRAQVLPDVTHSSINTILSDINKLKKHEPLKHPEGRKAEQKESFVRALEDLQASLKDFAKLKKEMPPVRMSLAPTQDVLKKELVKHLKIADAKLTQLSQFVKSSQGIPQGQFSEVTKVLHKTNMELMKVEAFATSNAKQLPEPVDKIIKRILAHIDRIEGVKIIAGAEAGSKSVQERKLRETLKEMVDRLRVLEILKKTRGGQASLVEEDAR